ncbi:HAAS signaling domain-containing protein [Microbacterium aurantiacum]|uniref:HAAS signaling domain-containing protein n=1 Tax=Microbacterium aurantiacum TaxID=162393 RepID=UPI000C7F7AA5|nr:hypothetical protein [Microbacterium aurantiacum]
MTQSEAMRLCEEFLARLDEAMRGVPYGVANDIRRGILEELDGLDADATADRIASLGDPALIAREAQAEGLDRHTPVAVAAPRTPMTQSRGFAIIAALMLGFGGFLVPVVGWVIGAVLVCLSPLWRRGEKIIAFAAPFFVAGVSILIISLLSGFGSGFGAGSSSGSSGAFDAPAAVNPLVPTAYDLWNSGFLFAFLLLPASALWLLWRLRGRGER